MEDVEIAWKALTLPILEPLTTDMLQKVTKIVKGKIFMKKQYFRFEGPWWFSVTRFDWLKLQHSDWRANLVK